MTRHSNTGSRMMTRDVDTPTETSAHHVRGTAFLDNNRRLLQVRYPNQWVAVESERILGSSPKLELLVRTLTDMHADPQTVVLEFIASPGPSAKREAARSL